MTPLFFTIPEACRIACIGKTRLYEEAAAGRLAMVKSGRRSLITAESLRAYGDSRPAAKLKPPQPRKRPAKKPQTVTANESRAIEAE
jgi:hypothetical protein